MYGRVSNWHRLSGALLAASLIAPVAGCGGKPPKEAKPQLQVEIVTAANLNRDRAGGGLPLVVRIYELKAQGAFAAADFFRLYDREGETLGTDLIAREELTLIPGQSRRVAHDLDSKTLYVGVIGAYRDIDHANWRDLTEIKPDKDNAVLIEVGADSIAAYTR